MEVSPAGSSTGRGKPAGCALLQDVETTERAFVLVETERQQKGRLSAANYVQHQSN